MVEETTRYAAQKKRPNPWVIALIVLIHIGIFYGLIRSFAPGPMAQLERSVVSAFTVTVSAPPEEPEDAEPDGAQGDPGQEAVARPVTAPSPKQRVREDLPAPRAASTGAADSSGATDAGAGTGAAGSGIGTGSGDGGGGRGGGAATKPEIISGVLNSSRDFPIPPGGREARIGTSVIVRVIVQPDGRATNCSVYRASPFPETDQATCQLVMERLRFRPATNRAGEAVAAPFYYQQRFFN
ncbi:TonB family protein [Erythrobacter sp.]|uniref:TonB family protein n=1 Tax=Erythrobacter sp. TaxID=1042 RepID=UPI00311E24AF